MPSGRASRPSPWPGLFIAALFGRSLIRDRRKRRLFSLAAVIATGLAFSAFLLVFRTSGRSASGTPAAARAEVLKSLPYSASVSEQNEKRDGVIEFRKDAAAPGLNLYNSYYQPGSGAFGYGRPRPSSLAARVRRSALALRPAPAQWGSPGLRRGRSADAAGLGSRASSGGLRCGRITI